MGTAPGLRRLDLPLLCGIEARTGLGGIDVLSAQDRLHCRAQVGACDWSGSLCGAAAVLEGFEEEKVLGERLHQLLAHGVEAGVVLLAGEAQGGAVLEKALKGIDNLQRARELLLLGTSPVDVSALLEQQDERARGDEHRLVVLRGGVAGLVLLERVE